MHHLTESKELTENERKDGRERWEKEKYKGRLQSTKECIRRGHAKSEILYEGGRVKVPHDLSDSYPKAKSKPSVQSGKRWRRKVGQSKVLSRIWIHQAEPELSCPFKQRVPNEAWARFFLNPYKETRHRYDNVMAPHPSPWQLLISESSDFIKTCVMGLKTGAT